MTRAIRSRLLVALTLVGLALLGACGSKGADVDDSLKTSASTPFTLTTHDQTTYAVGHGVVLTVPKTWKGYTEKDSVDGTTYEWAVAQRGGDPLPAYVQFSMGKKGKGAPYDDLPTSTRELGETDPTFDLLGHGQADVPGANRASYLRFDRTLTTNGTKVPVEQVQLFLDMPGGEVSTLRFIAPKGHWDADLKPVYDSLQVTEDNG